MAVHKHYFVVNQHHQSVHMKGPFESREAAREFVDKYRPSAPCWLIPAEYFGVVEHTPLNGEGQKRPREG